MVRMANRCGKVVWILIGEILAAWPVWAGPGGTPEAGRSIAVRAMGHEEGDAAFAVELLRSKDRAAGPRRCVLEVSVPVGVGVRELPRVTADERAVSVRLFIGPGPGGVFRYTLEHCPREGLPVRVSVGAGG